MNEKPIRPSSPAMDALLHTEFPVLDHGFIRLIDYMGTDKCIVDAARNSYKNGTKHTSAGLSLIDYLMRHEHTTPFEMAELKLQIKAPMFVCEQILRQRTASVNKESGRYSVLGDDRYIPTLDRMAVQSSTNGQGSGQKLETTQAVRAQELFATTHKIADTNYHYLVDAPEKGGLGLSRELARGVLPANQYVEMTWKIDAHNLMRFLHARVDEHAQWEIREYAYVMMRLFQMWLPTTHRAFRNHRMNAAKFSQNELAVLAQVISRDKLDALLDTGVDIPDNFSERSWQEFKTKIQKIL